MPHPDTKIRLTFYANHLDPDIVTEIMGLRPDKSFKPGDLRRNGKSRYKDGAWELIRLCSLDDVEKEFRVLLDELLLKTHQIEELRSAYDAYVSISVYGREIAEFHFDSDLHAALSALNLGMNICVQSSCKRIE